MTRLDHNRALSQLAMETKNEVEDIENVAIWGNHSPTMYPDVRNCTIKGEAANTLIDEVWTSKWFTPKIQQRGAEIIELRGASSAASAANAAVDHMRDWVMGSDKW